MNILLTGASGFIGSNIAAALMLAGHQLKCASRADGVDFCHMLSASDWLPQLHGIDAVINCVGIIGECGAQRFELLHSRAPIALFQACQQAGVARVVQISALGTDHSAFSAYHLSKRAADDYLRSLPLDWFVLRPSLIYGRGGKSAELFMRLAALPLIPVLGDGQQALQPVHIGDVVATVLQCLGSADTRQTLDILGPQTFSFAEWLQQMRLAQGLPRGGLLRIPYRVALAGTYLARYFNPMLQPDNLRMLRRGYRADCAPLARFLGRAPKPLEASRFFTDTLSCGSES